MRRQRKSSRPDGIPRGVGVEGGSSGRATRRGGGDRKTWQLCGQVGRTLNEVLAGLDDDTLREVQVIGVQPAPDAGRLLVRLEPLFPDSGITPERIQSRLAQRGAALRQEVAASIHRRKTPTLIYEVSWPTVPTE